MKFDVKQIVEEQSSLALVRDGKAEPLVLGDDATFGLRGDIQESTEAGGSFRRLRLPGSRKQLRRPGRAGCQGQNCRLSGRRPDVDSRAAQIALFIGR